MLSFFTFLLKYGIIVVEKLGGKITMQMTFTDLEHLNTKTTKKQKILDEMEKLVPFADWIKIISPYSSKYSR